MTWLQEDIKTFYVGQTDSTNLEVVRMAGAQRLNGAPLAVWADFQTEGRGQKGNSWEAERGKNLLFSVMFSPVGVEVKRQFRLSQAMALAICDVLNKRREGFGVKWPNDIYWGERKVSGTIIETLWRGTMVGRCVLGVGVNVNQSCFRSSAPNPVSLCQIVGGGVEREPLLNEILGRFSALLRELPEREAELAQRYMSMLIWRKGFHRYRDAEGEFEAMVVDVEADGHLVLQARGEDTVRRYMFKEVKHLFSLLECD